MDLFTPQALRGRLTDAASVRRFIEAGNATLTLLSMKTSGRYTYKFSRPEPEPGKNRPTWVKLLSGPDNEGDYSFMGTLWPMFEYEIRRTEKSRVSDGAESWRALSWLLFHLYHRGGKPDHAMSQCEVWHEGRCGRCGRKLTVPDSIEAGFGPECAGKLK